MLAMWPASTTSAGVSRPFMNTVVKVGLTVGDQIQLYIPSYYLNFNALLPKNTEGVEFMAEAKLEET